MKKYMTVATVTVCLLIGSLYPHMLLERHIRLVDSHGYEIETNGEYEKDIPVKYESGILRIFRSLI